MSLSAIPSINAFQVASPSTQSGYARCHVRSSPTWQLRSWPMEWVRSDERLLSETMRLDRLMALTQGPEGILGGRVGTRHTAPFVGTTSDAGEGPSRRVRRSEQRGMPSREVYPRAALRQRGTSRHTAPTRDAPCRCAGPILLISCILRLNKGASVPSDFVALRVKEVMVRELDLQVVPGEIRDDLSLYSSIIRLDSLALLQLIVALEEEFGCQIDDEDVMEAELERVASLISLVEAKVAV